MNSIESIRVSIRHAQAKHADVNAKNCWGTTPLHNAAMYGHKSIVEMLLTNKVDVNARKNEGKTPLYYAVMRGYKDIAELLRQHGGHE